MTVETNSPKSFPSPKPFPFPKPSPSPKPPKPTPDKVEEGGPHRPGETPPDDDEIV